jgi:hypothetical protein
MRPKTKTKPRQDARSRPSGRGPCGWPKLPRTPAGVGLCLAIAATVGTLPTNPFWGWWADVRGNRARWKA